MRDFLALAAPTGALLALLFAVGLLRFSNALN